MKAIALILLLSLTQSIQSNSRFKREPRDTDFGERVKETAELPPYLVGDKTLEKGPELVDDKASAVIVPAVVPDKAPDNNDNAPDKLIPDEVPDNGDDKVPDNGDDKAPDDGDDKSPDDNPSAEPSGPPPISMHGWFNVSALEDIPCNLGTTPLQIKTDGQLTGEKEINLEVAFLGGSKKALTINLEASPKIQISGCTETPISLTNISHLVGAELVVWTVSKSETSLTVISNSVESLIYDFSSSTANCSAHWKGNTTHVTFTASDTASHERRLKPQNCTSIPRDWHTHFRADKNFPVSSGTVVGVTCVHGDWNIGDSSIVCNTNLYSDFEYNKAPWCLEMDTIGSEVIEGSRTTLTCKLKNVPREGNYRVSWKVNKTKTTDGVETGDVVDGKMHSTIDVKMSSGDLGYWCYVEGYEDWGREVVLNTFTMKDDSKDSRVGDTAVLGCFVEQITVHPNSPKVVWKMGDNVLTTGVDYKITTKMEPNNFQLQSFLEVRNPSGDYNFSCEVTSGLYPTSPTGTKVVLLDTYKMSTECVIRNKDQSVVACQVEDIAEEMKIRWYKEESELTGALQSFEQGVQRSVLFLKPGIWDHDIYTCRVDSIKRPESASSNQFVNLATIEPENGGTSLLASPVIWCLVAGSVALCVGVGMLSVYLFKVRKRMETLMFRLSTREKIDSISERPGTILRNRTVKRDVESLRQTLDRRPPNIQRMSEIADKGSDDVFD